MSKLIEVLLRWVQNDTYSKKLKKKESQQGNFEKFECKDIKSCLTSKSMLQMQRRKTYHNLCSGKQQQLVKVRRNLITFPLKLTALKTNMQEI